MAIFLVAGFGAVMMLGVNCGVTEQCTTMWSKVGSGSLAASRS
jgi:Flp pilus assembly pilin Flp